VRFSNWKSVCEQLIRETAPEDCSGLSIALIERHEVDVEFPIETMAFTGSLARHFAKASSLPSDGFVAVFDLNHAESWQNLIGTALHEFAHYLDRVPPKIRESRQNETPTEQARETAAFVAKLRGQVKEIPTWFSHEARFVRACSHLAIRVSELCESIRPGHLRFGSDYYPHPYNESAWITSLEAELSYRGSIRELLDTEPPESFTKIYTQATTA
jgi:hypothetical protein